MSVRAVDGASLTLDRGRTLAVIGESGSGKSIMGLSVCGLLPATAKVSGRIVFQERSLLDLAPARLRALRGRQIAFVPQSAGLSLNPTMSCGAQVAEVYTRRFAHPQSKAAKMTRALLAKLSLEPSVCDAHPHRLSGGMRQRVLLGMGLAGAPDLLIADEPTKGIDHFRRKMVADLFGKVRSKNPDLSILLITHDIHLAERLADAVAVMYAGRIVEQTPAAAFFDKPRHPYSRALLRALPERGLWPIPGIPPHPREQIGGCVFHPRCTLAVPECAATPPPKDTAQQGLVWCWRHAHA
ncbi:MAG: ABC transporter ATP-binding protein [Desulfosarcinaceae bacterium]